MPTDDKGARASAPTNASPWHMAGALLLGVIVTGGIAAMFISSQPSVTEIYRPLLKYVKDVVSSKLDKIDGRVSKIEQRLDRIESNRN